MGTFLIGIIKTVRPRQWLKNLAVFTTVLFNGAFFDPTAFNQSILAFFTFCLLASSNYTFNDILDKKRDLKHPFKKFRPIASGVIPVPIAWIISIVCATGGIWFASQVNYSFFMLAVFFLFVEYLYSLFLKHISVIDILIITSAYFIRVYAGEAATGYHISVWLALTALSLALFLAIGKRRAELTLLQAKKGTVPEEIRASLTHYSEKLLDTYTAMFANSTFITYVFYTFQQKPSTQGLFFRNYEELSIDIPERKWLMITIPFVLYGIMRYMQLIYEGKGESPEKILTSDLPLLTTVLLWIVAVFFVVNGIGEV